LVAEVRAGALQGALRGSAIDLPISAERIESNAEVYVVVEITEGFFDEAGKIAGRTLRVGSPAQCAVVSVPGLLGPSDARSGAGATIALSAGVSGTRRSSPPTARRPLRRGAIRTPSQPADRMLSTNGQSGASHRRDFVGRFPGKSSNKQSFLIVHCETTRRQLASCSLDARPDPQPQIRKRTKTCEVRRHAPCACRKIR
jgi:hypothetical protein